MHFEFTCRQCETYVYCISPHPPLEPLCAECAWIEGIADPIERANLRKHFDELKQKRGGA